MPELTPHKEPVAAMFGELHSGILPAYAGKSDMLGMCDNPEVHLKQDLHLVDSQQIEQRCF